MSVIRQKNILILTEPLTPSFDTRSEFSGTGKRIFKRGKGIFQTSSER